VIWRPETEKPKAGAGINKKDCRRPYSLVKSFCVFKSRERGCLHAHLESAVMKSWRGGAGSGARAAVVDMSAVCACVVADKDIYSLSASACVLGSAYIVWWLFPIFEVHTQPHYWLDLSRGTAANKTREDKSHRS